MKFLAYLGLNPKRPDVFRFVSLLLLAATFLVVPLELGPVITDGLQLRSSWTRWVGYAVAVVFDAVWLGALAKLPSAVRQRATAAVITALGVSALGAGASVLGVHRYGSMPALALVPVLALAVHALGLVFAGTLADADTDAQIAGLQANDRNRKAQAVQGARSLALTRTLTARAEVAAMLADQSDADALEEALEAHLAARKSRRTKDAAGREKSLARVIGRHGERADAFASRGLLAELSATGSDTGAAPVRSGSMYPAAISVDTVAETVAEPRGTGSEEGAHRFTATRSEAELEAKGWEIYRTLKPRTWSAFKAAMREADHGAADARLKPVWATVQSAATEAVVDALREDVEAEEAGAE
ncbi:hypothetical protein GCM10017562_59920 [Streptomyces roseofulvus]|uniref:hypothetical protein n=1 Tax=Streptomyces roseofulvus TaxID=33902 RepID=UPI0031FC8393